MDAATVPIRWSKETEKREWMLEHGGGRPIADVQRDFEDRFGHPIKRSQVSLFRAEYGLEKRRGNRTAHAHGRAVPVGTERENKGYVKVKVRELPSTPQSKDNWVFKHVLIWERTRGLKLPKGWMVLFCDRDRQNFSPENLKAVPRTIIGIMNASFEWHDRATCEAAIAAAMLRRGMTRIYAKPRKCVCCGETFTPDNTGTSQAKSQITCRRCLDAGYNSYHDRRRMLGTARCAKCGAEFVRRSFAAKYCDACRPWQNGTKSKRKRRT